MSHVYSGRHNQEKISYQRPLPQFDFNSRVKLPPIIKNELLTGGERRRKTSTRQSLSKTNSPSASFPLIIETQPHRNRNQNGYSSQQRRAPVLKARINHVEKSPIHFPNSYTVLPPIGQTRQWPYSTFNSTFSTSSGNSEKGPKIASKQVPSQRKRSDDVARTVRDGDKRHNEIIRSIPNTQIKSVSKSHEHSFSQPENLHEYLKSIKSGGEPVPGISDEDIQVSECNPNHELERLELSKEVEEFLDSKSSQRRGAKCIEIDPSLKTAVDVIRDNLLRQTMEELCMMW